MKTNQILSQAKYAVLLFIAVLGIFATPNQAKLDPTGSIAEIGGQTVPTGRLLSNHEIGGQYVPGSTRPFSNFDIGGAQTSPRTAFVSKPIGGSPGHERRSFKIRNSRGLSDSSSRVENYEIGGAQTSPRQVSLYTPIGGSPGHERRILKSCHLSGLFEPGAHSKNSDFGRETEKVTLADCSGFRNPEVRRSTAIVIAS